MCNWGICMRRIIIGLVGLVCLVLVIWMDGDIFPDRITVYSSGGAPEPGIVVVRKVVDHSDFSALSKREQLERADALLIIKHHIDDNGEVVPIVESYEAKPGMPPFGYQPGDRYTDESYGFMLSMIGEHVRHAGDGALVLFRKGESRGMGNSIIRDGEISQGLAGEDISVEDAVRLFRGEETNVVSIDYEPMIEADFDKGEDAGITIDVVSENKDILVSILEREGLRYQVQPSPKGYLVSWVGEDEKVHAVMDEYTELCP